MTQSTREIKRRINSVQSTKQITRAMEMVAAAKLKRAEERAEANRPYEQKMRQSIFRVLRQAKLISHPLMEDTEANLPSGHIVMAADRGLCGGYNVNVAKKAAAHIGDNIESTQLITVGKFVRDYFRKRGYNIISEYVDIEDYPTLERPEKIAASVEQMFNDGILGEVYLTFSEFVNPMIQKPVTWKILPMSRETFDLESTEETEESTKKTENISSKTGNESSKEEKEDILYGLEDQIYQFEPTAFSVLGGLLSGYMKSSLYRALLESKASEQGARMTAMKNATDNAEEMIEELTLSYNKARQGAITQEILEVVSGAEALK